MKLIALVLAGVFVGVVVREVIQGKNPDVLNNIGQKASDMVTSFKSAFKDGYSKAGQEA
ncbi:MAG: hypothetical protein ACUZ8H_09660 [Candidatus Anammoxibacter sp.]